VATGSVDWDAEEHGSVGLETAWRLATSNGLARAAAAAGAPRLDAARESVFLPPHPSVVMAGRGPTPAQRQAAFMESELRSTVPAKVPPGVWPYPLPRGAPPFGEEPPGRMQVERSIFASLDAAADAAAGRAAASHRPPSGAAERSMLAASIQSDMEPWRSELPKLRASRGLLPAAPAPAQSVPTEGGATAGGAWLTPGATPLQPTPAVPSGVA
jgi:hypothetical protein